MVNLRVVQAFTNTRRSGAHILEPPRIPCRHGLDRYFVVTADDTTFLSICTGHVDASLVVY